MKTLKKISINPGKVLKTDELVNLKGGYGGNDNVTCYCEDDQGYVHLEDSFSNCTDQCVDIQNRWVNSNCAEIHQPYSYCVCAMCV